MKVKEKIKPQTTKEKRNVGVVPFVRRLYLSDPTNWIMLNEKKDQIYSNILKRQLSNDELKKIENVFEKITQDPNYDDAYDILHEINMIFIDYITKEEFKDSISKFDNANTTAYRSDMAYVLDNKEDEYVFFNAENKYYIDNKEYQLCGTYLNAPLYKHKSIKEKLYFYKNVKIQKDVVDYFKTSTTRNPIFWDKLTELVTVELYNSESKKLNYDKEKLKNIRLDKFTDYYGIVLGEIKDNKFLFIDLNYCMTIRIMDLKKDEYRNIDDATEITTKTGKKGYHYIYEKPKSPK